MPIQLFRVDERLIHGQVVIGWGSHLRPDRYVVVDDAVAESEWEQDLYALGLPDGVEVEFLGVSEAEERLEGLREDTKGTIVLCRNVETVVRLARTGLLDGMGVNLGGIHHGPGRRPVLSYVYLDAEDGERLRSLEALGVPVSAQDLPGSKAIGLSQLLA